MALTAAVYHLPPRVLPSIQAVEGGRVGLAHLNRNGTEDLGVMQINAADSSETSDTGVNDKTSLEKDITAVVTSTFAIH